MRGLKRQRQLSFPTGTRVVTITRCLPDCHVRGGKRQHLGRLAPDPSAVMAFVDRQGIGRFRIECRGRDGRILPGGAMSLERAEGDAVPRLVAAKTPRSYDRAPSPARLESQEKKRLRKEALTARKRLRASLQESKVIAEKVVDIDRIASELKPMFEQVRRQQASARQERKRVVKRLADFETRANDERRALEQDLSARISTLTETVDALTQALTESRRDIESARTQAAQQKAALKRLRNQVAALTLAPEASQAIAAPQTPSTTPTAPPLDAPAPPTVTTTRSRGVAVPFPSIPPHRPQPRATPQKPAIAAETPPATIDTEPRTMLENLSLFIQGLNPSGRK